MTFTVFSAFGCRPACPELDALQFQLECDAVQGPQTGGRESSEEEIIEKEVMESDTELYAEEEEESMTLRAGRSDDNQAFYRYNGDRKLPTVQAYGERLQGAPIKFAEPAFLPPSKEKMLYSEAQEYCSERGTRVPYIEHKDKFDDMVKYLRGRQTEEGREYYVDRVWLENLYERDSRTAVLPGGGDGYTRWRAGFPRMEMDRTLVVLSVHMGTEYTGMANVNEEDTALVLCET